MNKFKFIDLFAGIGGFHIAMSNCGGQCVFASEWDKHASNVYFRNFGIKPDGDITKIEAKDIPVHDILCAGFPCQAFSISGSQKGFDDIRGTLFFDIVRIVDHHKPKVLFLENVKNLEKHDGGKTFTTINRALQELGYTVFYKVLNASLFGLPQNRERVFIVAFRDDLRIKSFLFPTSTFQSICVRDILEDFPKIDPIVRSDIKIYKKIEIPLDFNGEEILPNKPLQIGIVNKGGQGERIYDIRGHGITLSAYGGGVGAKTGLFLTKEGIRRLTPRECARMQGFPENFILDNNINQAYKQFGNSVPINILHAISENILKTLNYE